MKLNVLIIALAATAFGSLAASAQTTVIEERRDPSVTIETQPSTTTVTKERGGFLGTETKTKTETTGAGINGDCSSKTVHKEDLTGSKTVRKTNCD
ncbi:MAG: hypothetical protein WDN48_10695 [Pseudolabrys sp.]